MQYLLCRHIGGVSVGLVIAGIVFLTSPAIAQDQRVTAYGSKDGLQEMQVWDGTQGPRGYLWLGLYGGGLSRFDGQEFTRLTIEDGLPGNLTTTVHVDSSGTIWVGTLSG